MQPHNDKSRFITALRRFSTEGGAELYDVEYKRFGYHEYRGERLLASALAQYLDEPQIPSDALEVNGYHDLPGHLADAFVAFRTEAKWEALREDYIRLTEGKEIFDLVNVHVGGLHRLLMVHQLARLMSVLTGETWLRSNLEAYFNAQQVCIDQAWRRFVRVGYRQLMPHIKSAQHRGNRGKFGKTVCMTYEMAGRVMFTFKRGADQDDVQITYIADASDMWGCRSGANATRTPFQTCVDMINEVSDHWNLNVMRPDDKIGM
jgi:hypothetical protein